MGSTNVLLSVRPQYAEAIVLRKKKYEVRRSVFKRKDVDRVYIYSTSPVSKIIGSFEVEDIIEDSPVGIWNACHRDIAISEEDFFRYFEGSATAFAIKIASILRFADPLDPYTLIENFRPPQSFYYISLDLPQGSCDIEGGEGMIGSSSFQDGHKRLSNLPSCRWQRAMHTMEWRTV